MLLYGARLDVDVSAPVRSQELFASEYPPRMLHQVAQQAELRRPEVDVLPVALGAVGRQVHGKVGEGQHLAAELRLAPPQHRIRSEEHTSELQSLMRISYAVFCLKKKKRN